MKIAVDLRSLQSGSVSGVENYTLNLLDALLALDKTNSYTLFYNSFKHQPIADLQFINSRLIKTRYPNRILNLALMTKSVALEKIVGDFDVLFMPNLNQFNIHPKAKLALTVHDLSPVVTPEFYDLKRKLWHKALRFEAAFKRADVIFAVSEYTKMDLTRLFKVPEHKIKVVYPGVDQKVYQRKFDASDLRQVRNKYGLPGRYILFLNTIEPRKNLSGLLSAFEALDKEAFLVIAGKPGWKYRSILNEIKHSKKSAKIKFIGYVSEQDKPAVIKLSQMLVYPSFYEGFGFQPLEAMSLGVPTIASSVAALPEVLGDASLLANPYDIDGLRQAIGLLLDDANLRQRLISKGFGQVTKYSWQKTAGQILQSLNQLK